MLPDENIIAVGGCVEVWTVYEMASACPGRHTNTGPTAACCVAYPSFGFVRDDQRVRHVRGEPSLVVLCSSAADSTTLPFSAT